MYLVLGCHNTRNVIPAVLKRESIDFAGYPLSRVRQFLCANFRNQVLADVALNEDRPRDTVQRSRTAD
jgi:hypothetical protein